MSRWPALVVLMLCIGGLIVGDRFVDTDDELAVLAASAAPDPVSQASNVSGSTWYCPAGFATPDAANDHVVVITNNSADPVDGSLTLYPSLSDTNGESVPFERAVQGIRIEPLSRLEVSISPIITLLNPMLATETGAFVGALVEVDEPGIVVSHRVETPIGADSAVCTTTAASNWWFPSGTTTPGVRHLLYLLNPFSDDAVVDVTFVTDEGVREPGNFAGRLLPAQSVSVLDVTASVADWDQATASVSTRSGRIVAERIQVFANDEGPRGVSLSTGANRASEQWYFPAGGAVRDAGESYVIFNPGDEVALVEFEARPDTNRAAADTAPISVDIGPGERWVVTLSTHDRHPVDVLAQIDGTDLVQPTDRYFATVRSFNGVPVVVERIITRAGSAVGVSAGVGATLAATDQLLVVPEPIANSGEDESTVSNGTLAILNPAADTIARVRILVPGEGGEVLRTEIELAPRRRGAISLSSLGLGAAPWVRVQSTTGVIVEIISAEASGLQSVAGVPLAGTTGEPDLLAFD